MKLLIGPQPTKAVSMRRGVRYTSARQPRAPSIHVSPRGPTVIDLFRLPACTLKWGLAEARRLIRRHIRAAMLLTAMTVCGSFGLLDWLLWVRHYLVEATVVFGLWASVKGALRIPKLILWVLGMDKQTITLGRKD